MAGGPSPSALLLLLTAVAVAGLFALPALAVPYHAPAVWGGETRFSTPRAWEDAKTLATAYPRRWSGSPGRQAAADWLVSRLEAAGLDVRRRSFPVELGGRDPVMLENLWGVSPGVERPGEIVVALGNYDMAPTSLEAASDTAAHVGVLLEMARVMHGAPHRRTWLFLFPDGEEWGMLGARDFVRTFPDRHRLAAAVSIEDLDVGAFRALAVEGIGQFRGYAPMWLRSLAAGAAAREGWPARDADPLFEWLQRSVLVSFTDQGPFLERGIPAVELAGRGDDPALQHAVYHLPGDTIDKMRPASVGAYGRIQERVLRSIDELAELPEETGVYLRVSPDRVVPAGPLLGVQALVFMPLVAAGLLRWRRGRAARATVARELGAGTVVLGVLSAGWLAAVLAPHAGLMPDFELYPATPRHPLLTDVAWGAVAAAAVAMAGTAALLLPIARRIGSHRAVVARGVAAFDPGRHQLSAEMAITTMLLVLLLIAVAGFADNPFGAVTFLLFPSFLWIWIVPPRSTGARVRNLLLVVLGFTVLLALFAQYAAILGIGPYILWYIFMSVAYGQFSPLRIMLGLATVAVGLRLVWLAVFERRS